MITEQYIRQLLSEGAPAMRQRLIDGEIMQGFMIVKIADWLDPNDWDEGCVISQDKRRIRLVAIKARTPGQGAFTRLIRNIEKADLIPVLVEPNQMLKDWCRRHGYRSRPIGKGHRTHHVWYRR